MKNWDKYAVCPTCSAKFVAPFGSLFHIHFECCPICGTEKKGWPIKTMRFMSKSIWWKPWTWCDGVWETKA